MGRVERGIGVFAAGLLAVGITACDREPTAPEVEAAAPASSIAVEALLDRLDRVALDYELTVPGEDAGVEGEAIEIDPDGTVVIQRRSPPYGYWYREGALTPVPEIPGSAYLLVRGIFPDGTGRIHAVVGYPEGSSVGDRPAVLSPDGSYHLLPNPGWIRDVNRRGRMVGSFWNPAREAYEAGFWEEGVYTALPPEYGEAYAVNDEGLMLVERRVWIPGLGDRTEVGLYEPATGAFRAPPGQLGPDPTRYSPRGEGSGLNEAGQAILAKRPPGGGLQSVIWDGSQEVSIPTPPGAFWLGADALNDGGLVAAQVSYPGDVYLPAIYRDGQAEVLDAYPGDRASIRDLDNQGRLVVGEVFSGEAYVFTREAGFRALPGRTGASVGVTDLNDRGWIVGSLRDEGGVRRPALWTPLGDEAVIRAIRGVLLELGAQGVLAPGVVNALSKKLGNGAYGAFVNQVEALVRSRRLESRIADMLIAAVNGLGEA